MKADLEYDLENSGDTNSEIDNTQYEISGLYEQLNSPEPDDSEFEILPSLWNYKTHINNFQAVFSSCSQLQSVPPNLFANYSSTTINYYDYMYNFVTTVERINFRAAYSILDYKNMIYPDHISDIEIMSCNPVDITLLPDVQNISIYDTDIIVTKPFGKSIYSLTLEWNKDIPYLLKGSSIENFYVNAYIQDIKNLKQFLKRNYRIKRVNNMKRSIFLKKISKL